LASDYRSRPIGGCRLPEVHLIFQSTFASGFGGKLRYAGVYIAKLFAPFGDCLLDVIGTIGIGSLTLHKFGL